MHNYFVTVGKITATRFYCSIDLPCNFSEVDLIEKEVERVLDRLKRMEETTKKRKFGDLEIERFREI